MSTPIKVDENSLRDLSGKTILITGASSGIGLETAEFFYELGCNVVFVGGRKRPQTEVPLENNPRTLMLNCDISSWDSLLKVFKAAVAKFGHLDIVCANAGVDEPPNQYVDLKVDSNGDPLPLDLKVIDVDLKGTAYTIALGIHYMKGRGGSVIMMSSMSGYHGTAEIPNYSAAKHGTIGLLRSIPPRAESTNVAVSLVAPHIIFTPGTFQGQYQRGKEVFDKTRAHLRPLGLRLSSSRTCALAVAYLAQGGMKMAGKGLVVEDDEINECEAQLLESRPDWFKVKEDHKAAEAAYAAMRPKDKFDPPKV